MRVGLLGGTFDPPHRGHLALGRLARERLALDRLLVAPVAAQPLKHATPLASFDDRIAMARLAFAGEPKTEISAIDAARADGQSNYTIDTLNILRRQLSLDDDLFCIMGADSFLTIAKWHRAADLLVSCDFIVGARPGFDLTQAAAALPNGVSAKPLSSTLPNTQTLELKNVASAQPARRLYLLMDLDEDVSATQIRSALRHPAKAGEVLRPSVQQYIRDHGLYAHL